MRAFKQSRRGRPSAAVPALIIAALVAGTAGVTGAEVASAATKPAASKAVPTAGTAEQAVAKARAEGKKIEVPGTTTSTSKLVANPDGTFTSTQSIAPVRKLVAGTWRDLDATLHKNSDGSISPATSSATLSLSGGGDGPLARVTTAGRSLAVSLPLTLPKPALDGATATYAGVAKGIDLQVTADEQGGFAEVLVVHDAQAAANPLLKKLALPLATNQGLTPTSDATGNITVKDPHGQLFFTAPAATMWDSKKSTTTAVRNPQTGERVSAASGEPLASSHDAPGLAATVKNLHATISKNTVVLTPDPELLSGPQTVYPVYIDPSWTPNVTGSLRNSWTYVNSAFPSQSYWKTSDPLQVGYNGWQAPLFKARTFFNVSVPSQIYGAEVISSSMSILEQWAPSCNKRNVELWKTGKISSTTDWGSQPDWTTKIDTVSAAHGYDGCDPANIGFDTTTLMRSAASGRWKDVTIGLKSDDETDKYGWKKFSKTIASFSTTYNHTPDVPTTRSTSPATSCSGTVKTVGDGDVALYVKGTDPDRDRVGTTFSVTTAAGVAIADATTATLNSGDTAKYILKRSVLDGVAHGVVTKINWRARVTDYRDTSGWSTTCGFNFDPTRPGAPSITDPGGQVIGTPTTFSITPPETGTAPTSYDYQLNGAAPKSVTGTTASITLTPPRYTNVLTVTAISAGGNVGDTAVLVFNASAAAITADGDLTGDGIPDLLNVGSTNGLPSGLWLNHGQAGTGHTTGDGQVIASATNLGVYGTGFNSPGRPLDFDGAQVISGRFTGGGLQDTLVYYPSGPYAGNGAILNGNGDGSAIAAQDSGSQHSLLSTFLDPNNINPVQVVSAGDMSHRGLDYPDVITVGGDATGYYLSFFPSAGFPPGIGNYEYPTALTTPAPDGTMNWAAWQIATAKTATGHSMFLWNSTTKALYLWKDPSFDYANQTFSIGTQYLISSAFNPGTGAKLRAADINGDGTTDLWATTTGPTATAYQITNLSTTSPATVTAQPAQTLLSGSHSWQLNDPGDSNGNLIVAADSSGSLPATGNSGVASNDGDLFSPDADLNGTTGNLGTAGGPALTTNADFTVSAWVKPAALTGTILSQQGTKASGLALYIDPTTKRWYTSMAQSDVAAPTIDANSGYQSAKLQTWTRIGVTYKKSTGSLVVYVDGIGQQRTSHTVTFKATGQFKIGSRMTNGAQTNFFKGQIANVQVWNQALTPSQMAQQSGTPGYVLLESDNTNYASGSSWTTARGKMTFVAGKLTVTPTTGTAKTYGTSGYPNAVLTVQTDGNMVIYPQAAHTTGTALWSSATNGHPNASAFFQPDGNFVIYDSDGTVLWKSATANAV